MSSRNRLDLQQELDQLWEPLIPHLAQQLPRIDLQRKQIVQIKFWTSCIEQKQRDQ